jgi:glycosyltransferase involved in cell wall biosynthesis
MKSGKTIKLHGKIGKSKRRAIDIIMIPSKPLISIITPCFNEELNVENCASELRRVMESRCSEYDYEHIFVDNASTDLTYLRLKQIASKDSRVKVILNSRNVGPFRNMWHGLKNASGQAVIPLLPADLQDPPTVIPDFLELWEKGHLVVHGVRRNRKEFFLMRMARSTYYRVIRKFADVDIPLNAGEFMLIDRRIAKSILSLDDQYPYIRGLVAQCGVKSAFVDYDWRQRERGKSRNSLIDLVDQAINGFVSTSKIPARLALLIGFFLSIAGIFGAFVTTLLFLFNRGENIAVGIPTAIVSILFFAGIQLLFLGLIGEYVLSIHGQVRKSPPMFEIERINLIDNESLEKNEN